MRIALDETHDGNTVIYTMHHNINNMVNVILTVLYLLLIKSGVDVLVNMVHVTITLYEAFIYYSGNVTYTIHIYTTFV